MTEPVTDLQAAANELLDSVQRPDLRALHSLSAEQLEAQGRARAELFNYLTDVWEQAKARGEDPANNQEYRGIGALRDILGGLMAHVTDAQF